jgi:hypothetical protein
MPKSPFTGHKPWILLPERSPHGPEPITLMADGERIDNNLPYYVRSKEGRNKRAYTVKMCNAFGMHLICPRQGCRRSGTCADADLTKLPYCFHRYRESFRHALFLAMEHYGMYGHDAPNSRQTDFGDAPPPEPFTGVPLVQRLLDAGAPREVLERPTGVGITDWTCERDESAKASMAEMRERRLAREAREKGNAPRLEADLAPKRG